MATKKARDVAPSVTIDGYPIDVAINEEHAADSDVTEFPVEDGSDITDNIRAKPVTLTLECIVSDTPLGAVAAAREEGVIPSDDAYARLRAIRDERRVVTVETGLRVYEHMAMTSLSVPRSAGNGAALRFRAAFRQVKLVVNKRIFVAVPIAVTKVNLGDKKPPPAVVTPRPPETFPRGAVDPTVDSRLKNVTYDSLDAQRRRAVAPLVLDSPVRLSAAQPAGIVHRPVE